MPLLFVWRSWLCLWPTKGWGCDLPAYIPPQVRSMHCIDGSMHYGLPRVFAPPFTLMFALIH